MIHVFYCIHWKAFACAEMFDCGKPIEEAEGDIDDAIDYLRWAFL